MWPGLVGKGPGSEPFIDLDTMLNLTAMAESDGARFEGVDLFLSDPHIGIDSTDDQLKELADKIAAKELAVGSVVAPVWPPTGGGSAMGKPEDRHRFVEQVRKASRIARTLREIGIRPYGVVRIDSATDPESWLNDPEGSKKIASTFRECCNIAEDHGERLAAEGEICWGGMHSWKRMVQLLELVDRPETLGFQADMAHTLLYTMGYNAPEDAILPEGFDWKDQGKLHEALRTMTHALRPWTFDFHVAQNDATVKGSGSHDKTGRHCLPDDPKGKLNIARDAGYWLRDDQGKLTKAFQHICWDGCMFPNEVMMKQQTWNDILSAMISVRDAHGWREIDAAETKPAKAMEAAEITKPPKPARKKLTRPAKKPAKRRVAKKAAKRTVKKGVKVKAAKKPVKKASKAEGKKVAKEPVKKSAKPKPRKAGAKGKRR